MTKRAAAMSLGVWLAVGLLLAGCDDDELITPSGDTGNGDQGTPDATDDNGGGGDQGTTDGGGDDQGTPDAEPDTGPTFEALFVECTGAGDCTGDGEVCHESVCVDVPNGWVEATLWREEDNDYIPVDGEPDFSCWETPEPLGEANPATATVSGDVALFGPESRTVNLCVSFYDEDLLLRWMVWLDQNVCGELKDVDPRDQVPYVNCFGLDPCRCADTDFTTYRGDAVNSEEACFAEIGFCAGITDSDLQEQCRANILERTGIEADTLIFATTTSIENPQNPDRTEGVYTVEDIPVNERLVVKVSGTPRRWRDTYEYGAIIRASEVTDGQASWDGNVITDGAWRTIPQSAGIPEPTAPDRAAVAGIVRDCTGTTTQVMGALVGFIHDPVTVAYFNGVASDTLPQPGQAFTNTDGVYAAISLEAGADRVSAMAQQGGQQVNAGSRNVFVTPYSVIIATFEGNWE